jgi:hypothetical protein
MPLFRNARACLEAIVARYAAFESYSDVGVVEDVSKLRRPSCWFNTQFESPSLYRFEFVTAHPFWPLHHIRTRTVLGSDGERNYYFRKSARSASTIELADSLLSVVSRAAGVSQGTATTIGKLLLPDLQRFSLAALRRPRFRANRTIDGMECLSISGIWPGRGRFTLWVGKHDLLLRRLLCHEFHLAETRSQIEINQAIPKAAFHAPLAET